MYWWNLSQTLTNPNNPEWDHLAYLTLGENVHPERKTSFLLARNALWICLKEAGKNVAISELILKDYSGIKGVPEFILSLSHTKSCGAALVAPSAEFRSVGIDVEDSGRVVKKSIIERVGHPEDDRTLRNIELWSLKEAAFKALMNTGLFPKPVEFSSLSVANHTWSHSPSELSGKWELEHIESFVIARAFLKS